MVSLVPVVERTSVDAPPPWRVLGEHAPYHVLLSAAATDEEIGSVVWQLAQYNGIPVDGRTAADIVADIAGAQSIVLPGGVAVLDAGRPAIMPGCCAGLEDWRMWATFEQTGETPWMGHDPDPWLERAGDTVRVWSHGDLSDASTEPPFAVEIPLSDFRQALRALSRELEGFWGALRTWAERTAPAQAEAFVKKFDVAFEISQASDRNF